ncbi:MAG: DEAD/DEAH box helicase [Gemmatimonadales bacterium]
MAPLIIGHRVRMRVCGLFIGIDQYADESIDTLRYAERDAAVLHAGFADLNDAHGNPESDCVLLAGAAATRERILAELAALVVRSRTAPTDAAIVHFSGHGAHDGRILAVDTIKAAREATAIDLARVSDALSDMRATNAIITLDSCFAGTVRGEEGSANAEAFNSAMLALTDGSRTVAWGAGPFEEAREVDALRHGVFSHGLIRGLYGEASRSGDRFELLRWLQGAIAYARDFSRSSGRVQTPQAHLQVSGEAYLPAVPFGPRQARLRAQDNIVAVTHDPESICAGYDWADEPLLTALKSRLGPRGVLNPMQIEAISRAGILAGRSVVVCAPTAAGKTIVGELASLRAVKAGQRALVVLPMRALVNEQWDTFSGAYEQLGLRVIRSCGDITDDDAELAAGAFDIAFVTYEKLLGRLMAEPTILDGVGTITLDEIQLVCDEHRGRTVELLVARLRRRTQRVQVVALCGEVGELNGLHDWLAADLVIERNRPVPLHEGTLGPSGAIRFRLPDGSETDAAVLPGFPVSTNDIGDFKREEKIRTRMVATAAVTLADAGQMLIFRTQRHDVFETASAVAQACGFPPASVALAALRAEGERSESSKARALLQEALTHGVGIHLSDLNREERSIVEAGYRSGEIRVVCSTTTLAMGVNLPARTVVLADDSFFAGVGNPRTPISVGQYRQMGGRAGRNIETTSHGEVVLVSASEKDEQSHWERYVGKRPENLHSGLGRMPKEDFVLALATLTSGSYRPDIQNAALDSFWAYEQRSDDNWRAQLRLDVRAAIETAIARGFIERNARSELQLTAAGVVCASHGIAFRSACRVLTIIDGIVSTGEPLDGETLIGLAQATEELDRITTPRIKASEASWRAAGGKIFPKRLTLQAGLEGSLTGEELDDRHIAARFRRCYALRRWIAGHAASDIENEYSTWGPGFGPFTNAAERTADMLPAIAGLVASRLPGERPRLTELTNILRGRIRHGVTAKGEPLMRLGIGLRRTEAEALARAGIGSAGALLTALLEAGDPVAALLGSNAANALRAGAAKRRAHQKAAPPGFSEPLPDLFTEPAGE